MSQPTASTPEALLAKLPAGPDVLLHKVDLVRGAVLAVEWSEAGYRGASFLDDRILGPAVKGAWLSGGAVAQALAGQAPTPSPSVASGPAARRPLHFIFHAGHVGSTLLSRLLDELPAPAGGSAVLGLREPLPLRTLAEAGDVLGRADSLLSSAQFGALQQMLATSWQRGYAHTQVVVLKATSSTTRVGPALLAALPAARAVCLNLAPEPYLATLLAGENAALDLRGHGPERMRRLQPRTGSITTPLHAMALGEQAALAWLAEAWSQRELAQQAGTRVLAVDFDRLLGDVEGTLSGVLRHFGLDANAAPLLARSPVLTRYSKATEHAYSPALRQQLLAQARRDQAVELQRGMRWLETLAAADANVAALLG
ncbi:MAG: hypothetical protein RJB26_1366 [Pseudomonadota bacterium]